MRKEEKKERKAKEKDKEKTRNQLQIRISKATDLWDELVLDSGSVSTECPYAWCSDISVNNEDKVYLQDIPATQNPVSWIKSGASGVVGSRRDVLSAKSSLMLQMLRTQLCHWER